MTCRYNAMINSLLSLSSLARADGMHSIADKLLEVMDQVDIEAHLDASRAAPTLRLVQGGRRNH